MSLLVAGSLHLDIVLSAPHLPGLDETVTGTNVAYAFGGKGGNQALAAARMGADVCFAGRAGSDRFGDVIREVLVASGMDLSLMQSDPGPSGMSAAIIDDNGDYGAVIVSAANLLIEVEKIVIPTGTKLVLLQNEIPEAVNLAVARKARAAKAQVWLNAAPARPISGELAGAVDLLIINRVEAAFYSDLQGGFDRLTTLGAEGVSYRDTVHPGFSVKVISTHGAGDMFVGALAARAVAGETVEDALSFAQAAAALHVSAAATERGLLSAAHVSLFLKAQAGR